MVTRSRFAQFIGLAPLFAHIAAVRAACSVIDSAPLPQIDISDPIDAAFSVCASGQASSTARFRDCAFDFGDVEVGQTRTFSFTVNNPSAATLSLFAVNVVKGADAITVTADAPAAISGGQSSVVDVQFAPQGEGIATVEVRVESDAANLDDDRDGVITDDEQVVIDFAGRGVIAPPE
jgi:hypothetical protein